MQNMYSALNKVLIENHRVLTSQIIPVEKMPILNFLMFRLEAFGDVQNETQILNYFNLCKRNPRVQFTIWTKNAAIFKKVFENGNSKPKNLIIIVSSPMMNKALKIEDFPFADKVFTVYTRDYALNNGIKINCGSKSCASCAMCYNKNNRTVYINELLK
jgi:hypothetical protein